MTLNDFQQAGPNLQPLIGKKLGLLDSAVNPIFTIVIPNGHHSAHVRFKLLISSNCGGVGDGVCGWTVDAVVARIPGQLAKAFVQPSFANRLFVFQSTGTLQTNLSSQVHGDPTSANTLDIQLQLIGSSFPVTPTDYQCVFEAELLNSEPNGIALAQV